MTEPIKLPPLPDIPAAICPWDHSEGVVKNLLEAYARAAIEADRKAPDDTVLTCDSCGVICQNPWHTSHGENRHVHLCDACYEADRQAKGEPVAWEFSHNGYWTRTSEPEMHKQMGRPVRPLYTAPQPQQIPDGLSPIETIEYWRDAYAKPNGDQHFMGHGMVAKLLKEYAQLRAMLEAAPPPVEAGDQNTEES